LASDYASSGPSGGSSSGGPGGRPPRGRGRGRYTPRRKVCQFCVDKIDNIDYKDVTRLRRYISERGKIEPRRKTGTCAKHQRRLSRSIKRARQIALLPFAPKHIQELGGWFQPPPFMPTAAPHPAPVHAAPAASLPPAEAEPEAVTPPAPVETTSAESAPAESAPSAE
jgi:small subunit ribosomal protein S18